MRTFAGTLLLENIFDFIPHNEMEVYNLGLSIFNPNILIVENDCKTTLGKFETLNYESEGLTELATESRFSYTRITNLLSSGVYTIATRHTSTCISKDGVCKKCYSATFPADATPKVLDRVNIKSEYLVNSEIIPLSTRVVSYTTTTITGTYDNYYVFIDGKLLSNNIDYTLSGNTFTLFKTFPNSVNIVIRFMKINKNSFLGWLADTYSGSLLGMKPIPFQLLPVRPLFLSSTLLENRLQSIGELIKTSNKIPKEYSGYIDLIKDPLEQALYMLAIFSIYYNVSS